MYGKEAIRATTYEYSLLCRFVSLDLPYDAKGSPASIARSLRARAVPSWMEPLREALDSPSLAALRLDAYVNRNAETGFVAMAFRDPTDRVYCVFRGSEWKRDAEGVPVDWVDNLLSPLNCSVQYKDVADFVRRYPSDELTLLGHSKGGHNALYALAIATNPRARTVAFNAQGFAPGQLERGAEKRLAEKAVHDVVETDPVGALLRHPEKRVFVRYSGTGFPHSLEALRFNDAGECIPGRRPVWSYLLEWSSRAAAVALRRGFLPCLSQSEEMQNGRVQNAPG